MSSLLIFSHASEQADHESRRRSMGADTIEGDLKWTVPGAKVPGDKVAYKGELRTVSTPLPSASHLTDSVLPRSVVIDNVLKGEHSAFVREDELEASWEIFTPFVLSPPSPLPRPVAGCASLTDG